MTTQNLKTKSLPKTITSDMDIWTFFNYLHNVDGVTFHPEEDFNVYVNGKTNKPTFTYEEAKKRNVLMDLCFEACSELGLDIFTIAMEAMRENLGLQLKPSQKSHSGVVVCKISDEYVDEDTGEVIGFCKNKFYNIDKEESIYVYVKFRESDDPLCYRKWVFEKYFRYAEDWEAEGFKENLWDSL